ncbi:hypothetical protein ACJ73_08541 [Blastomyces percursus]|uniref:Uncharacterized protein n=1 Tax=Blastomyces percursus TaxID=1658174 RepID=A0A1J9QV87_9EURO|nr:hypothetical protein ACJ73_08541 [Blastomyces percursus]
MASSPPKDPSLKEYSRACGSILRDSVVEAGVPAYASDPSDSAELNHRHNNTPSVMDPSVENWASMA